MRPDDVLWWLPGGRQGTLQVPVAGDRQGQRPRARPRRFSGTKGIPGPAQRRLRSAGRSGVLAMNSGAWRDLDGHAASTLKS